MVALRQKPTGAEAEEAEAVAQRNAASSAANSVAVCTRDAEGELVFALTVRPQNPSNAEASRSRPRAGLAQSARPKPIPNSTVQSVPALSKRAVYAIRLQRTPIQSAILSSSLLSMSPSCHTSDSIVFAKCQSLKAVRQDHALKALVAKCPKC